MSVVALAALSLTGAACRDFLGGRDRPGLVAWSVPIVTGAFEGWRGTPAGDDHYAFVETDSGVAALEWETGRIAWSAGLYNVLIPKSYALILNGGVLFLPEKEAVYALDAATGKPLWAVKMPSPVNLVRGSADEHAVYVGTEDTRVLALDRADGRTLWTASMGGPWTFGGLVQGISVSGDTLYVAATELRNADGGVRRGQIIALDRLSGRELWRYTAADRSGASDAPTIVGRLLLTADILGGSFFALDRFTGQQVWRTAGDSASFGPGQSPQVAGDTAFVASNDRFVYAADVRTGRLFWSARSGGSIGHFALCGPRIITNEEYVTLFDRASHAVTAHWPDPDGETQMADIIVSGFAVHGAMAVVMGQKGAYGVRCD